MSDRRRRDDATNNFYVIFYSIRHSQKILLHIYRSSERLPFCFKHKFIFFLMCTLYSQVVDNIISLVSKEVLYQ